MPAILKADGHLGNPTEAKRFPGSEPTMILLGMVDAAVNPTGSNMALRVSLFLGLNLVLVGLLAVPYLTILP